jgi:hypothetical protein
VAGQTVTIHSGGRELTPEILGAIAHVHLPEAREHTVVVEVNGEPERRDVTPGPAQSVRIGARSPIPGRRIPIDLSTYYDADSIKAYLPWRSGEPVAITLPALGATKPDASGRVWLEGPGGRFNVSRGKAAMVMLERGQYDGYISQLVPSRYASSISFPIGAPVRGLEVLFANEIKARLTGVTVGHVDLIYADGEQSSFPLTVGENVDSLVLPFATDVTVAGRLPTGEHVGVWSVESPHPERTVARAGFSITAHDAQFGILAINAVLP